MGEFTQHNWRDLPEGLIVCRPPGHRLKSPYPLYKQRCTRCLVVRSRVGWSASAPWMYPGDTETMPPCRSPR